MTEKEIDHEFTDEIVCPYCGHKFSDSWEYLRNMDGSTGTDIECVECDETFFCEPNFDITYVTSKKKAEHKELP